MVDQWFNQFHNSNTKIDEQLLPSPSSPTLQPQSPAQATSHHHHQDLPTTHAEIEVMEHQQNHQNTADWGYFDELNQNAFTWFDHVKQSTLEDFESKQESNTNSPVSANVPETTSLETTDGDSDSFSISWEAIKIKSEQTGQRHAIQTTHEKGQTDAPAVSHNDVEMDKPSEMLTPVKFEAQPDSLNMETDEKTFMIEQSTPDIVRQSTSEIVEQKVQSTEKTSNFSVSSTSSESDSETDSTAEFINFDKRNLMRRSKPGYFGAKFQMKVLERQMFLTAPDQTIPNDNLLALQLGAANMHPKQLIQGIRRVEKEQREIVSTFDDYSLFAVAYLSGRRTQPALNRNRLNCEACKTGECRMNEHRVDYEDFLWKKWKKMHRKAKQ